MKKQATSLDKILSNHMSDKGLVSKIHRELPKLSNEKMPEFFLMGKVF